MGIGDTGITWKMRSLRSRQWAIPQLTDEVFLSHKSETPIYLSNSFRSSHHVKLLRLFFYCISEVSWMPVRALQISN